MDILEYMVQCFEGAYDEDTLREDIVARWGAFSIQAKIYDDLRIRYDVMKKDVVDSCEEYNHLLAGFEDILQRSNTLKRSNAAIAKEMGEEKERHEQALVRAVGAERERCRTIVDRARQGIYNVKELDILDDILRSIG